MDRLGEEPVEKAVDAFHLADQRVCEQSLPRISRVATQGRANGE